MKKIVGMLALAALVGLASEVWAGSSCCSAGKPANKEMKADAWSSCSSALSGMELTAEQKEKIAAIEADCNAQGKTPEACSASMGKIRDVLTEEQKTTFDAATKKSGGGGCG